MKLYVLLLALTLGGVAAASAQSNWPQWRGPNRDGHLKSQRVMAIEVETGRELWTSDQSFGKYMSLVAQGDRILALDQRGSLHLLRANKEKFDPLDQRKLTGAESWAHLAVAGDQLFVRELNALAAWRWQSPSAATPQE